MGGDAAEADATGPFARPAADATAGRFLIFLLAGAAGIACSTRTGFGVSFGEEKTEPSSERIDTVSG
jgi:hypothetical protein